MAPTRDLSLRWSNNDIVKNISSGLRRRIFWRLADQSGGGSDSFQHFLRRTIQRDLSVLQQDHPIGQPHVTWAKRRKYYGCTALERGKLVEQMQFRRRVERGRGIVQYIDRRLLDETTRERHSLLQRVGKALDIRSRKSLIDAPGHQPFFAVEPHLSQGPHDIGVSRIRTRKAKILGQAAVEEIRGLGQECDLRSPFGWVYLAQVHIIHQHGPEARRI